MEWILAPGLPPASFAGTAEVSGLVRLDREIGGIDARLRAPLEDLDGKEP